MEPLLVNVHLANKENIYKALHVLIVANLDFIKMLAPENARLVILVVNYAQDYQQTIVQLAYKGST